MVDRTPKKKWELTKEAFDKFLACLDRDPEQAGREYLGIRERLKCFFEHRGCPYPNELIDETFDRVVQKVFEGELLSKPAAYCGGVAWNVLQEYWHSRARLETGFDGLPTENQPKFDPERETKERDALESKRRRRACQRQCVTLLDLADRELILPYYVHSSKAQRIDLAAKLGIRVELLRLQVFRIRRRLRECTSRCLEHAQTT